MADTPQRRNKVGERRRRSLIEAAVDLIERHGIGNVRAADVARAAAVPNSLFYWYFKDFDDLLAQAIVDARRTVRAELGARLGELDDVLIRLAGMVHDSLLIIVREPSLRVLLASQSGQDPQTRWVAELHKTATVFMNDTVLLLVAGQAQGLVRADVPATYLAYCLRSLANDAVISHANGLLETDLESLARHVTQFSLRGICTNIADADRACTSLATTAAA